MRNYFKKQLQCVKSLKVHFRKGLAVLIAASIFSQFPLLPQNDAVKAIVPTPDAPPIGSLTSITVDESVFGGTRYALPANEGETSVQNFLEDLNASGNDEDNSIKITTEEQFKAFAFLANDVANASKFDNKYIELATDIDLNGGGLTCSEPDKSADYTVTVSGIPTNVWAPIGTSATPFAGHFNGGGYTIRNLVIAETSTDDNILAGFFGVIVNGSVKNLNIGGESIIVGKTTYDEGYAWVGGVVGSISGDNSLIANCGTIYGAVCTVVAQSTATEATIQTEAGGVLGNWNKAGDLNLENCTFEGNIFSSERAGGVAGSLHENGTAVTITSCWHAGTVAAVAGQAGGIVSGFCFLESCEIDNCIAEGTVTGEQTGGIIGGCGDIKDDIRLTGLVVDPETRQLFIDNDGDGRLGKDDVIDTSGAELPTISTHFYLTNCSFDGDVKGTGQTGGIIAGFGGYLAGEEGKPSVMLATCRVTGNVVGGEQTGGIVAGFGCDASIDDNSKVNITQCEYLGGKIYGGGQTGGIVAGFGGRVQGGLTLTFCSVNGDVIGDQEGRAQQSQTAGLISGFHTAGSVTVDGCTHIGGVFNGIGANRSMLGGILGGFRAGGDITISNNRFEGTAKIGDAKQRAAGGMMAEFSIGGSLRVYNCDVKCDFICEGEFNGCQIGGLFCGTGWAPSASLFEIASCTINGNITATNTSTDSDCDTQVGGLFCGAGWCAAYASSFKINDCTLSGNIAVTNAASCGHAQAGGLFCGAGWSSSSTSLEISGCTFNGNIAAININTSDSNGGCSQAGGLFCGMGWGNSSTSLFEINECKINGNITASNTGNYHYCNAQAGGLFGGAGWTSSSSLFEINGCMVNGNIITTNTNNNSNGEGQSQAGGLFGGIGGGNKTYNGLSETASSFKINRCAVNCNITATNISDGHYSHAQAGGLFGGAGWSFSPSAFEINACTVTGDITVINTSNGSDEQGNAQTDWRFGGVAGGYDYLHSSPADSLFDIKGCTVNSNILARNSNKGNYSTAQANGLFCGMGLRELSSLEINDCTGSNITGT